MPRKENNRIDHKPGIRQEFERHKKRILATQSICGICGQPVDKALKYPDPGCATIDHIIPVSRGGHPSDINNLQLAHFRCNRRKFNQLTNIDADDFRGDRGDAFTEIPQQQKSPPAWSLDWTAYRYDEKENKSNSDELWQQAETIRMTGCMISIHGISKQY